MSVQTNPDSRGVIKILKGSGRVDIMVVVNHGRCLFGVCDGYYHKTRVR